MLSEASPQRTVLIKIFSPYQGIISFASSIMVKKQEIIVSKHLDREVLLDLVYPAEKSDNHNPLRLLLVNDGQDAGAYRLQEVMHDALTMGQIGPTLAVAVHVGERRQEYGISGRPDFGGRGTKASLYAAFVEKELLPFLQNQFAIRANPEYCAVAGFSLGALSAFDLCWHLPGIFGIAGLFSGSFWWRTRDLEDGYKPSDRIALQLVKESDQKKPLRFWFQTGWLDEYADRDGDGLIDSVGDTLDLISELRKLGYMPGRELEYLELGNGRHDHKTMARIFPAFLNWWQKGILYQS